MFKLINLFNLINLIIMKTIFTILACLFISIIFLFNSCSKDDQSLVNLDQGLVAHYKFDGDFADNSTNNNHAQNNGCEATTDRYNKESKAYQFDGDDDYIRISHHTAIDFNQNKNFTISIWISPDTVQIDRGGPSNEILTKWDYNLSNAYPYTIRFYNINADSPVHVVHSVSGLTYDGLQCNNVTEVKSPAISLEAMASYYLNS